MAVRFPGEMWPKECFPVIQAVEDSWINTKFYFLQENVVPSLPAVPYTGKEVITVVISVQWGWLDIFSTVWQCHTFACKNSSFSHPECSGTFVDKGDLFGHIANPPPCNVTCALGQCSLDSIIYSYEIKTLTSPPKRILTIEGKYDAINHALHNLTYRPDPFQNSLRLRSRLYSPVQAQLGPYEKLLAQIYMLGRLVSSVTMLVHIEDVNNAPVLTNPTAGYKRPTICDVNPLTTFPPCHFGQFYRNEDTDKTLSITGVQATDVDLFETCTWAVPQCAKVAPSCKAKIGDISQQNLNWIIAHAEEIACVGH
jgi:hypothetical protein